MRFELSAYIGSRYSGIGQKREGERFVSFISVVSLIGMALGVTALLVVVSVMNGFDAELKRRILGAVPHVVVSGSSSAQSLALPAESDTASFLQINAMLLDGDTSHLISLFGVDPVKEDSMSLIPRYMVTGEVSSLAAPGAIILGAPLAFRLGLLPGDIVTVIVPDSSSTGATIRPRIANFRLAGTFELDAEPDYHLALVDVAALMNLMERTQPDTRIRLENVYAAPIVAARLGNDGHKVTDWSAEYGDFFRTVRMEKLMMFLLLFLIVVIAAFNIVSSLAMMVREKRGDIAVLRTMGMTKSSVMLIFVVQGSLIGAAGILIGTVIGLPLAFHVAEVVAFFEQILGGRMLAGTYFDSVPVEVRLNDVLTIIGAASVVSVISTLYPAYRASQLVPAQILRHD